MNFRIVEQPESVKDEDLAVLLRDAHQATRAQGMLFKAATGTGADLRKRLGENGKFFVAITEDNEIAGVLGVSLCTNCRTWCGYGKPYVNIHMVGVATRFKRQGINGKLYARGCEYGFQFADMLLMNTSEDNIVVIDSNLRHGWKIVDYISAKGTNYYSVVMAKWRDVCPYSDIYIRYRFTLRKIRTKAIYREDGSYRKWARIVKHRFR